MEKLFDSDLLRTRKLRALRQGAADFLMRRAADDLGDRLSTVKRHFGNAASVFSMTGDAAAALRTSNQVGNVTRLETDAALLRDQDGIVAEPETVPLRPAGQDLIVSLLSMHEVNDLPGLLIQIRRALAPDGLFLGAMAGAGTLAELRESLLAAETELTGGAAPRVYPFVDVRDAGGLLQRAGFALPVTDLETVTVRYPHLFALMADLRAMGSTSALAARSRRPASRRLFARAAEIYAERYADADGRIRATFATIWMSGWAPHASQPKPLKPGSVTVSLAEALERARRARTDGDQ